MTRIERLYARRRKLDQERRQLNKLIAKLEGRGCYVAAAKIHHANEGCSTAWLRPRRAKKVTKNWKNVDCMTCLQRRAKRARRKQPTVPWTAPRRSP